MATKKLSSDESRFSPKKMSWKLATIKASLIAPQRKKNNLYNFSYQEKSIGSFILTCKEI